MIKKIQQYLLTNHPIIWNIKLVPMVLLIIAIQIIFFTFGYISTDNTINYGDRFFSELYFLVYAGSLLVGTLLFIFWLIRYNRNNGLKVFYPHTNLTLYLEWICIFVICIFIGFIPNSLSLGKSNKWKSAATQTEQEKVMQILNRSRALLPADTYYFELDKNQQPIMVGDANVDRTKFDTKLYNYEEDAVTPDNPIEYVGPSLLYFKDNMRSSYWRYDEAQVETVHQWLVTQNQDSIRATMQAFLDLHKKHNLKTNLDIDSWMTTVYNPPLYPVTETIADNDYNVVNYVNEKYTQQDKLYSYYEKMGSNYEKNGFDRWYIIVTLTIAMGLSVLVFSSRVTSGKSWIFALLSAGVLIFAFSLLSGILALFDGGEFIGIFMPLFWIGLFAIIGFVITLKVVNGRKKGKSNIYVNLGIWMIPALIPWIYQLFIFIKMIGQDDIKSQITDYTYIMLFVNLIFTLIVMFPAVMLIRKWKALPED